MSEATRAWLYRIALAVVGLAVAFGFVADEKQIAAIIVAVTAVFGNGLAALNTSTKKTPEL